MGSDMTTNSNAEIAAAVAETHARAVREQTNLKLVATSSNLTDAEIKQLAKGMVNFLRASFAPEMMEKFVEPLLASRTRRLEERIRELEQRHFLTDAGVWNASSDYHPGYVVTHDGSCWVCKMWHSNMEPGKHDVWRLLVKRGRDGRDSR